MTSRKSNNFCQLVPLYVLGVLDGDELVLFKNHLAQGCSSCTEELKKYQSVVDQLSFTATDITPPPSIRASLLQQIKNESLRKPENRKIKTKAENIESGLTFIKATDDHLWNEIQPGIWLKPLFMYKKQGRMTAIARMDPNTSYAAHRHTAPEEFYVLEGSCYCGGQLLYPGDYHRAETGSIHSETSTENGCQMLISA